MEKAKLKYIEEQCNRIANGMEQLSGFTGKGQLHLYEHIDISKGIEIIAAVTPSGANRVWKVVLLAHSNPW